MKKLSKEELEKTVVDNYCKIVESIILLSLENSTISPRWKRKLPSKRLLKIKKETLSNEIDWLQGSISKIWFDIFCRLKGGNAKSLHKRFSRRAKRSLEWMVGTLSMLTLIDKGLE